MESQQQERNIEQPREADAETQKESVFERQQQQQATTGSAAAANSPPVLSESSSPSHEFSFTISLHSSKTTTTMTPKNISSSPPSPPSVTATKTKHPPTLAIDMSPADEIFFHGHLLPLHFLSHLHNSSPRPSTHSLDNFAPPITNMSQQEKSLNDSNRKITCSCSEDDHCISSNKHYRERNNDINDFHINLYNCGRSKERASCKSKTFSLFGLPKWKKGSEKSEKSETSEYRKKVKFDVTQFIKRYLKMVKPFLSPRAGRRESVRVRRQSYSFSGMVSPRDTRELIRGRRGEFSAPASMRTSPTNSGLLHAKAGVPSPASDSTMEELQSAIAAAIAHCKNSISAEDKSPELSSVVPVN